MPHYVVRVLYIFLPILENVITQEDISSGSAECRWWSQKLDLT